jgi:carbonic anhydrase
MNGRTLHYLSSVNLDAMLAVSKANHEHDSKLAHKATHYMTTASSHGGGGHGADLNTAAAPAMAPPPAAASGHRRRAGAAPTAGLPAGARKAGFQFGYDVQNGPLKWALHYSSCIGYTQSPVNLNECALVRRSKNKMFPRWKFTSNLKVKNNGHTLLVDGLQDSFTEYEGQTYKLDHFLFHSGSEHLLHYEQYPLELQLVHTLDEQPALIVSVIFDVGAANPDLTVLHFGDEKNIPRRAGQEMALEFPFNPVHFMPYNKNYYAYDGSLTIPPCTEGIKWVVMQSTMSASSQQIATFPFRTNYRNPQPLYGRPVYFLSQKDQYQYQTVTTGSSSMVHVSWALLILSTAAMLLLHVH